MQERKSKRMMGVTQNASRYNRSTRLAIFTILYGVWLVTNQSILKRYLFYELLESIVRPEFIAMVFLFAGIGSLVGIIIDIKFVRSIFSIFLTVIWSTWAISFFITPPPNSIWVFSAFVAFLSYEAIWADRL